MRLAIIPKILVLCVCVLAALGQDTRLSGPVPGFVFHSSSQAIRPIMGLPGSAHLGPAIAQGFEAFRSVTTHAGEQDADSCAVPISNHTFKQNIYRRVIRKFRRYSCVT